MRYIFTLLLTLCVFSLHAQHEPIPPSSEFRIKGLVKNELIFRVSELMKCKQDELGDVVIRNHKGEEKGIAKSMKGILLKTLIDSAGIHADKPKDYSELYIVLTASDNYKNVYSWNELFNSEIGNHIYVVTGMDGKTMDEMPDRILVLSAGDFNAGRRHLKGLVNIEVKKAE